jgi:4-amino-4-deoxychorismate lyase
MSLLVESIRVENSELLNISFHNERMQKSILDLFGKSYKPDLEYEIKIPDHAGRGILKCRIEYDTIIRKIEFIPYNMKIVRSLKLVEDNTIEYAYKFADRAKIEKLVSERGNCDEILIVKNGMITDSSYANVIFRDHEGRWITPLTYLLAGTRRASLLLSGEISEAIVTYNDIGNYSEVKLINSMIGIDDTKGIPITSVI